MKSAGCSCATITDEYHGYRCAVTDGACVFFVPNSKLCAEMYGEGPDAWSEDDEEKSEG